MRVLSWNLYHGRDFPPDPALFTWRSRLFGRTELGATHAQVNRPLLDEFAQVLDGLDVGRGAAPGGPAALVSRALPAHALERRARAHLAQLAAAARSAPGGPEPRPDRLERGRLEPDPRASPGPDRRSPPADARLAARAAANALGAARLAGPAAPCAWPTSTPRPACPSRRPPRWCERPSGRSNGRRATRWCSAATSTCVRRARRAVRRAARALGLGGAHRARRDRPSARPRVRGRGAAAAAGRREARAARAGRPADPALRPRAGERGPQHARRQAEIVRPDPRTTRPRESEDGRAPEHEAGEREGRGGRGGQEVRPSCARRFAQHLGRPAGIVMLSRDRIEEALDEAVKNGQITAKGARTLAADLVKRGRKQTDDVLERPRAAARTRSRRDRRPHLPRTQARRQGGLAGTREGRQGPAGRRGRSQLPDPRVRRAERRAGPEPALRPHAGPAPQGSRPREAQRQPQDDPERDREEAQPASEPQTTSLDAR